MSRSLYRFGACSVDPAARELRRDGALVKLSPKVFDCLAYLIAHRDRAVGRDELIAAVWGRADVSDTLLGQTVLKARRAIGDPRDEEGAIRTIPRFGYRWIAPIVDEAIDEAPLPAIEPSAAEPPPHETPPSEPSPTRRFGFVPFIAACLALALVAGIAVWHRLAPEAPVVAMQEAAVAVMPVNVAAGEESGWLRLGLMDLIASRLRHAGQAVVPSDNVVALSRTAGGATRDALRDATGARYVIEAQADRVGTTWRVNIRLDDGATGVRNVTGEAADPIDAAREASDALLPLLGKSLPTDRDSAALSLTEVQQRSEAALLGNDITTARQLIEDAPPALRETPLLRVQLAKVDFRSGRLQPARQNLETLLAQTPAQADAVLRARALYTLGAVAVREDRSDDAVHAFDQAIGLIATRNEPGVLGRVYTGRAAALVNLGRHDEAAADLARARVSLGLAGDRLALAGVDANEGVLDNARGRHAEALPILQRAADYLRRFGALNDMFLTAAAQIKAHLALLDANAALAATDAVWAQREQLDNPRSVGALGVQRVRALAAVGRLREAKELLDRLDGSLAHDQRTGLPGDLAAIRARLALDAGDADTAIVAARRAVSQLTTLDEAPERARAWLTLVRALRAGGRLGEAREEVAQFGAWSHRDARVPPMSLYLALAEASLADATPRYAETFDAAERWGVPMDLAAAAVPYAKRLIDAGDLERAAGVAGRLARWADQDFDCALLQARLYHALGRDDAWRLALDRAQALAGERALPPALTAAAAAH